ncbi:MAG: hypothetical protein J3R72DRAFT_416579 [Linnemannia gamsii]|nr:MAG: hypothetical protein J3R72DRAFT_416579 [Linnemannia gamsii]
MIVLLLGFFFSVLVVLHPDNGLLPELLLLEADLWKESHDEHNEIITKAGRCLFPCLKFKAINLDSDALYSLRLDFEILSPDRLRFSNGSWKPVESVEHADDDPQVGKYYTHPDGFQLGSHWMVNPISFAEAKLTNKAESQSSIVKRGAGKNKVESGNTGNGDDFDVPHGNKTLGGADRVNSNVLHVKSFHKYRAILKSTTHRFDPSAFIAETQYQKEKVNDLKKAHNPHAKGLRGATGKESLPVKIQVGQHQQQQKRRAPDSQSSSTTHPFRPNKRSRTSWRSEKIDSDEGVGSGDGDLNGDDMDISAVADAGTSGGRGRGGRTTNRSRSKAVSAAGRSSFAARVPPEDEMNIIPPPPTLSWHQQSLWDNNTTNNPQDALPTAAESSPVAPSNDDRPGPPLSCQLETVDSATVGATHSAQVSAIAIPSSALNPMEERVALAPRIEDSNETRA